MGFAETAQKRKKRSKKPEVIEVDDSDDEKEAVSSALLSGPFEQTSRLTLFYLPSLNRNPLLHRLDSTFHALQLAAWSLTTVALFRGWGINSNFRTAAQVDRSDRTQRPPPTSSITRRRLLSSSILSRPMETTHWKIATRLHATMTPTRLASSRCAFLNREQTA